MMMCSVKHRLTDPSLMSILAPSLYRPTPERVAACAEAYQLDPCIEVYACLMDGIDAGLILFTANSGEAVIQRIATGSAFRGQGVGRFMIDQIMALFQLSTLSAETDDDAVGFYRRCGFDVNPCGAVDSTSRYLCRKVR